MMLRKLLLPLVLTALKESFGIIPEPDQVLIRETPPGYTGQITVVCFPFAALIQESPHRIAATLGTFLQQNLPEISEADPQNGFLNLTFSDAFWWDRFLELSATLEKAPASPVSSRPPEVPKVKEAWRKAQAIANRADEFPGPPSPSLPLPPAEIRLILQLCNPSGPNPVSMANTFTDFYHQVSILGAATREGITFRIKLCEATALLLGTVDTIVE